MAVERNPLPFTSYQTRAPRASVQRLVNCYAEKGQQKGDIILYGDFGISTEVTLATFPQRGAIEFQEKLHVVSGTTLYRVHESGAVVALGTITGAGHVEMVENGAQLGVLTSTAAFSWNGATLTKITDPDFPELIDWTFIDNFVLGVERNSGRFIGSQLGDLTSYDGLDFATAEAYPDNLVGIASDHGQAFLAGARSCELWDDIGGSGFPFARNFNGVIEQGCGAGRSIVKADQTLFWIDDVGIARRLDGVTPVRVSQHGVEQEWSKYSTLADAEGFSIVVDGHILVIWTFPTAGKTWVFDITSQQWHEKESYGLGCWRVKWAINIYGKTWAGDLNSGKIGIVDPDIYQEYGDLLVSSWTYPSVYAEKKTAFHRELETIMETGVGNTDVTNPEIIAEVSDDGGRTYEFIQTKEYGKIGNYRTIVTWTGLGSSPDRVYRQSISDPARRAVFGSFLSLEQGVF